MTVVTGFRVIFAISDSISLADAGVVFASMTITPSLPMMIPVFPPAPPWVQYTSLFNCFTESGGGCCWAFATPANVNAVSPVAKTSPIVLAVKLLSVIEMSFPPELISIRERTLTLSFSDLRRFLCSHLHILGDRKDQIGIVSVPVLDLDIQHC